VIALPKDLPGEFIEPVCKALSQAQHAGWVEAFDILLKDLEKHAGKDLAVSVDDLVKTLKCCRATPIRHHAVMAQPTPLIPQ
jgi:hypothetical protein